MNPARPSPSLPALTATPRTTLKRRPDRGSHDRATLEAILDEALVCHVAVVVDGAPRVLPTAHVRVWDRIYIHGARANRLFGELVTGAPACVTATLLDGLVFARSWFHHSMNYRCAVLHGAAREVSDPEEKLLALAALVEKAAPGRTRESRPPTPQELEATLVLSFPIDEASAKIRTGPPLDSPEQWADACWAGELPVALTARPWKDDPNLRQGVAPSAAVGERGRTFSRRSGSAYERTRGDLLVSTDPARVDFAFVSRFLSEESYWARGVEERHHRLAMTHSLCFGLYRGTAQIGFARVLSDYGRFAYLADVFVMQSERGMGLGKWLVASILQHPDLAPVPRWLLGTADAHGLYERFGFVRAEPGRYMVRASEATEASGASGASGASEGNVGPEKT